MSAVDQTKAYDEGEHVKEVFAYYGRACYEASVLETGLAMANLQADFLCGLREEYRSGRKQHNRADYEAAFDRFLENQHAQTFGNLIKRLGAIKVLSDGLKAEIAEAKKRRDFLVHHYFRARAEVFVNREGRDRMISELHEDGERFERLDQALTSEVMPIREKLGMTSDKFKAYVDRFNAAHRLEPEQ